MQKKYALIGRKIDYSLSPRIYNYWFKKYNIDAIYEIKDISTLLPSHLLDTTYVGYNYTTPFKKDILNLDLSLDIAPEVKIINAVNVSHYNHNKVCVYNTDYLGLIDSYRYFNLSIYGKNVLVVGGSGAAAATIYSTILEKAANVYVYCRQPLSQLNLINNFSYLSPVQKYKLQDVDIIFNATTTTFDEIIRQLNLDITNKITYDLNYYHKNNFKPTFNGLVMLLYQASHNFNIWFNFKPFIDEELLKIIGIKK